MGCYPGCLSGMTGAYHISKLEPYPAHALHSAYRICSIFHAHAWAESTCICICIVGMVDGYGYDGQLKYTICDVCRPCHLILYKHTEAIYSPTWTNSLYLRIDQVPWRRDLAILVVTTDRQTDYFTPEHVHWITSGWNQHISTIEMATWSRSPLATTKHTLGAKSSFAKHGNFLSLQLLYHMSQLLKLVADRSDAHLELGWQASVRSYLCSALALAI